MKSELTEKARALIKGTVSLLEAGDTAAARKLAALALEELEAGNGPPDDEPAHGDAWPAFFGALAESVEDGQAAEYSITELMEAATKAGVLESLTAGARNPKIALGMILKQFRGRQFNDGRGRPFEFGHRKADAGARYKVRILTPEPPAAA